MTERFTELEVIHRVQGLTRTRLISYCEARIVTPVQSAEGPIFRQIDLVRLELLCELTEGFELDGDALALVMSLIDRLHGTRGELTAVLAAIEDEPAEVRDRITKAALRRRGG